MFFLNYFKRLIFIVFAALIFSRSAEAVACQENLLDLLSDQVWGTSGMYAVKTDTVSYEFNGKVRQSYIFLPDGKSGRYPVILFCHGINETDYTAYSGLIYHIVSNGYGLIYTPYKALPYSNKLQSTYDGLKAGLIAGVRRYSGVLDTSRIGFIGHSFGGGALPYISHGILENDGWGRSGSFLYIMAPWYPCVISRAELMKWPSNVRMLVQVFDDDRINDPRIARAIYNLIGIPQTNKRYMILYSDSVPGCHVIADHGFPCKRPEEISVYEKNGLFRTFDLLAAGSFDHDSVARNNLFCGEVNSWKKLAYWRLGSPIREALITTIPRIEHPQNAYVNFWDHTINPLNEFNTNFDCPKPVFFHTRITIRNYWRAIKEQVRRGGIDQQYANLPHSIPTVGFGAPGPFFMETRKLANPRLRTRPIQVFLPRNNDSLCPVIFFSHSFMTPSAKNYQALIEHLVSRGNIVIYSSSSVLKIQNVFRVRYDVLFSGFQEALDLYRHRIDTTRIGFIGNSFAAGAMPAIARKMLSEKMWGENGSFLFLSTPWYPYYIDKDGLQSFPLNSKLVVEVFQDDHVNDWRIGFDVYKSIGIPDTSKNFLILLSDRHSGVRLRANHQTMLSRTSGHFAPDALDFYGIYRIIDALEACAFYGDTTGMSIALGKNGEEQKFMGTWNDATPIHELVATDDPAQFLRQKIFFYSWRNFLLNRRTQKKNISGK